MLNALIDFSLKNRFVVLLLAGLLIVVGVRSAIHLPLDAFPDTTPVQVQINTVAPELSPEEVERLITFPVEYALGGLKGLEEVRSRLEVRPLAGRGHLRGRDRHLLRPPADQRTPGRGPAARGHRAADDGAGRHRAWARSTTTSCRARIPTTT